MADLRAALGHALEPLYRVEREVRPIGSCRMFVALGRTDGVGLLVKVLPGALSLAIDSSRFEQRVRRLTEQLGHPDLVAPRGAGRAGSCVYHTRPFVEGTTLRAWLARHGELPLRRAVGILRDVLTGLAPTQDAETLETVRSVPSWLGELARRCCAPDPGARWADASAALAHGTWPTGGI